jgi:hypothetical protein
LYPFWRHSVLESLLLIPYSTFPYRGAFYPKHDWKTFFLSYFYHFTIWVLQVTVYRNFKKLVYPPAEKSLRRHEGTYPSALTGAVSDIVPLIFGLGFESVLLRRLAQEVAPPYMILNALELGNVGLLVKAVAAEWAVEWAWLEFQYWANEWWYRLKG